MIPVGFYSKCTFLIVLTLFFEVDDDETVLHLEYKSLKEQKKLCRPRQQSRVLSLLAFLCLEPYRIMLPSLHALNAAEFRNLFLGRCTHVAKTPGTVVNILLTKTSTKISPEAHHLHCVAFPPKLNELNCIKKGCWLLKTVPHQAA